LSDRSSRARYATDAWVAAIEPTVVRGRPGRDGHVAGRARPGRPPRAAGPHGPAPPPL